MFVFDFCSPFLVGNVGGIFGIEKEILKLKNLIVNKRFEF